MFYLQISIEINYRNREPMSSVSEHPSTKKCESNEEYIELREMVHFIGNRLMGGVTPIETLLSCLLKEDCDPKYIEGYIKLAKKSSITESDEIEILPNLPVIPQVLNGKPYESLIQGYWDLKILLEEYYHLIVEGSLSQEIMGALLCSIEEYQGIVDEYRSSE